MHLVRVHVHVHIWCTVHLGTIKSKNNMNMYTMRVAGKKY